MREVFIAGFAALSVYLLMPLASKVVPLARQLSNMARPAETFSMAFVTAPNHETAKSLASGLVSGKLAACVNILPGVTSVYEWEGKVSICLKLIDKFFCQVNEDPEILMMIKTRTSRIPELTEFVQSIINDKLPGIKCSPREPPL